MNASMNRIAPSKARQDKVSAQTAMAPAARTHSGSRETARRKKLKKLLALVVSSFAVAATPGGAYAQSYPSKPIRMIVPFPPGGLADIAARIIGPELGTALGQSVIIDNRAGAGGIIGTEIAAKAAPDGYTILLAVQAHVINAFLHSKLPYDPINDFAPVVLAAEVPQVLMVHPSVAAKSIKELIALANSKPEGLNYASGGAGTATHLAAELFKSMTGAKLVHVPYKGAAPAMTDLLGGQVPMAFVALPVGMPYAESGKLRALGLTGSKRSSAAPNLPTIAESGVPGYEASTWTGVLTPAGTPREVISKLNKALVGILQIPDVQKRLSQQGFQPVGGTPEEFNAYLKVEMAKWGKVVKESGARAD